MASAADLSTPDDKNQQQQSQGATNSMTSQSIGGPQGGGTVGGAAPAPANTNSSSSGRFNNLQKYIGANQDFNADQGGLAGTMANNINQQANQVQNNFQGAQKSFQNAAQGAASGFQNTGVVDQALQDPYHFSQNQDNVKAFTQVRDAQYNGPKGLEDLQGDQNYNNLRTQASNVQDQVNQAQTEPGRFNLLRNMFGKQDYTNGEQNLDNLMIQSNQGQLNKLSQARSVAANTNMGLNSAQQQAQQTAQNYGQQAQQTRDDVRGRLNQTVADQDTSLVGKAQDANTARDTAWKTLQGHIGDNGYSDDEMKALGLTAGEHLYNTDVGHFVTEAGDATKQQVASADDYNRFKGLGSLMGTTANEQAQKILGAYADPTQAGTAPANPYTADTAGLNSAIQGYASGYQNDGTSAGYGGVLNEMKKRDAAQGIVDQQSSIQQQLDALSPQLDPYSTYAQGNGDDGAGSGQFTGYNDQAPQDLVQKYNDLQGQMDGLNGQAMGLRNDWGSSARGGNGTSLAQSLANEAQFSGNIAPNIDRLNSTYNYGRTVGGGAKAAVATPKINQLIENRPTYSDG